MQSISNPPRLSKWDPGLTERVMGWIRPLIKGYHRAEVRGLDSFPAGGALVVSNHSGGLFPMDVPVFATGFYEKFGYDRPVYTLSHDMHLHRPDRASSSSAPASFAPTTKMPTRHCDPAAWWWCSPAVTTTSTDRRCRRTSIDFDGRTGYVRAAMNAGVPIVPAVAIGGQESQLYLSRGMGLAKALRLDKLMRVKILPISVGFPFGLSAVLPVNVPLPTKIVMQVLEPIDVTARVRRGARHRRGRCPRPPRHAEGARRVGQSSAASR